MPSSYTAVFGGETISPAQLSYIAYTTAVPLTLVWPLEAPPNANVAADKVDIHTNGTNIAITLPPGNQASVGQDILFRNVGSDTFYVYDQNGVQVAQLTPSTAWYVVLTDNSTTAGVWYAIQFGVGTSEATAASLAGAGLRANLSLLDQNLPTNDLLANYSVTVGDRATVLQNNGGAVVWTFASAVTLGNGFFVYVINTGSGSIVLTPFAGQTIDDNSTKTLAPTESLIVFSDGLNLHTLGYGRSLVNTVTGVSMDIAGTGVFSLTSPQIAAQIQDWSGTLTGDRILDYGGGVGYWFVRNNTTGAHTVTARVNGLDAGVGVTQGTFSILRSNGTNMAIAFTATTGTVMSVATTSDLVGGPITTTGTLGLSNTGVAAGTYGSANSIPSLAVDSKGRVTSATGVLLSIANSAPVTSAQVAAVVTDETGTGLLVFNNTPAITNANLTTPSLGIATATSINGNTIPVATDVVTLNAAAQTLSNKTLTSPTINGGSLSSTVTGVTQPQGDNSTKIATTAYVDRGSVQQVAIQQRTDYATGTTQIPFDDTIPQITEGDEYFSVTLTPKSATSRLVAEASILCSANAAGQMTAALFRGAGPDALAVSSQFFVTSAALIQFYLRFETTSGSTLSTTFTLRCGTNGVLTFALNGSGGGRVFGGTCVSSLSITEYGS